MKVAAFPIRTAAELEALSAAVKWQYFEKLVAFVFEENGFDVEQNVVVTDRRGGKCTRKGRRGSTKRQFDVIARRYGTTLLVECKKRKGAISRADIEKHAERCEFYGQRTGLSAAPLVVTLKEQPSDMLHAFRMPVVPVMKLNAFLNSGQDEAWAQQALRTPEAAAMRRTSAAKSSKA